MKHVHELSLPQLIKEFNTDPIAGLLSDDARARLKEHGKNIVPGPTDDSWFKVFIQQFNNPLIYILLVAATIIFFVGEHLDAFIISGVLFFNAIIGSIQEGRTRSILATLSTFLSTSSIVIRDGKKILIDDVLLVPGDIILLQEGGRVPADARIIESNGLQVDESILTGESRAVHKIAQDLPLETAILDQINIAFKGTYLLSGNGKAIVVRTGSETEIGKIHKSVHETLDTQHSPLADELHRLSHWILLFIIGICGLLFVIGFLQGKPFNDLLAMLTALFICVVPEGLPVVLTLVLVTGVYRLARNKVLIKNMQAADTLGRTNIIAIDKTGTLTRNELVATKIYADETHFGVTGTGYYVHGNVFIVGHAQPLTQFDQYPNLVLLGTISALLNRAEVTYIPEQKLFDVKGDPTEAALGIFAEKIGISSSLLGSYKKLYEIPFDPRLRFHSAAYEMNGNIQLYMNGSPEVIEKRCGGFSDVQRAALNEMLAEGLRVVAVAYKKMHNEKQFNQALFEKLLADGMQCAGFIGIQDAIRPEVSSMIEKARAANLKVIMITGDHQKTALFVARKVGILGQSDQALDGAEFTQLSTEELMRRINKTTVYSRITPDNKLKIIKLYRNMGYTVAMTGDGINDAPSLVAADIGIAMGTIGTEITKQAADMVLLDDSFASIMNAIEEGRHLFYTMRRVILYFFATNFGEILVVLLALIFNLPVPILPAQILWLNLVTDGFLDIALSMEPKEPGLLSQSRAIRRKHLVDKQLIIKMIYMAIPMGVGSILVFYITYQQNLAMARSLTLVTMAMFQWFNAWNCRSETKSIFQLGLFSNRWLLLAFAVVFGLQILVLNASFMQSIFKTVPLSFDQWLIIFGISSSLFLIEELRKLIVRLTR
jgi:Ca2+-transporting ATPase